jgi:hypothetical protein
VYEVAAPIAAQLVLGLMQAEQQKEAARKARQQALEDRAYMERQNELATAKQNVSKGQDQLLSSYGQAAERTNASLQNIISAFQRAAR